MIIRRSSIKILALAMIQLVAGSIFFFGCDLGELAPPSPQPVPGPVGEQPDTGPVGGTGTDQTGVQKPPIQVVQQTPPLQPVSTGSTTPPEETTTPPTETTTEPDPTGVQKPPIQVVQQTPPLQPVSTGSTTPPEETTTPPTETTTEPVTPPPEPLMKSAEELLLGVMARISFSFGLDKPLLDYDRKQRKAAKLEVFLGVKPAVPELGNQLVLIAPTLAEPFASNKIALRTKLFETSAHPDSGLKQLILNYLEGASFTKKDDAFDPLMQHKSFLFTALGPYKEYPIYATGEKLSFPRIALTNQKDIDDKGAVDKIISDYNRVVNDAFLKLKVLDQEIAPKDLKPQSGRGNNPSGVTFGPSVESLIIELESFVSKHTDARPHSVFAILKKISEKLDETDFTDDDATDEKFLVNKDITERVLSQIDDIGDRCRTKWEDFLKQSFNPGIDQAARQRLLSMAYIYEEHCEVPILKLKAHLELVEVRRSIKDELARRGIDTSGTLDVFAKRASSYLDRVLATLIPTTPPPDLPPAGEIPETPQLPPRTEPSGTRPLPPPPTILTVSALQKPIDDEVKEQGFLATRKYPLAYDARVLDQNQIMSDEVRTLTFYLGVKGKGPKNEKPPFKLYIVGPRLVDSANTSLDLKTNYQFFFDTAKNPIYPFSHVPSLEEEAKAPKGVMYDGRQLELTSVTQLPPIETRELYDQALDGAPLKERDAQIARLNDIKSKLEEKYGDKAMEKAEQEIRMAFLDLDLSHPDFAKFNDLFLFQIASRITEFDIFAEHARTPWRELSFSNWAVDLSNHADVQNLLSSRASDVATNSVVFLRGRTQQIKAKCMEVKSEVDLVKPKAARISKTETIDHFRRHGCNAPSIANPPISATTARSCLNQMIDNYCILPADRNLERLKSIYEAIEAQKQSFDDIEKKQQLLVVLEELVTSLTKKYQMEKPQKTVQETLEDEMRRIRQRLVGPQDDDTETWD